MEFDCANCGNTFDGANGHFIVGEARLCSSKCDSEYKRSINLLNPLQQTLINRGLHLQEDLKENVQALHSLEPTNPPLLN